MKSIKIKAPAKINLYLAVLEKRKDGFHNLDSVLQVINLFDEIKLKEGNQGIKLSSSSPKLSQGEANLAYRAARIFLEKTCLNKGLVIELKKHIPIGAGLGGGSSDAAAVLSGLNRLWNLKLDKNKLLKWAKELGSDVPFFIEGKTARVRGRGEKIKSLKVKKPFYFLLFFPGFSLSTAEVYKKFSQDKPRLSSREKLRNEIKNLSLALKTGDLDLLKKNLYNNLEKVVFKLKPQLLAYQKRLSQVGLRPLKVCGSGSTLFAPVRSIREAKKLAAKLKLRKGVYIVKSLLEASY